MEPTQKTWYSTAIAIQNMEYATEEKHRQDLSAQFDQFSVECEDRTTDLRKYEVSPDGNWIAAGCSNKIKDFLIVQRKDGEKWVLNYQDFLSPDFDFPPPGYLSPKFWSLDGNYFYFIISFGYSGGGDDCFPLGEDYGQWGLFRLNLVTGSWVTLIPTSTGFPGYAIEFSPTGRRYAIGDNDVIVRDIKTGEAITIQTNDSIERISWSPDGTLLAYSTARCDEDDYSVISSALYIWDSATNKTRVLLEVDGEVLRTESWVDKSTLRIVGEENLWSYYDYTIYQVDVQTGMLIFSGTPTPYP